MLYREDFRRMYAQCGYHRPWPDGERFLRTATSWEEYDGGRSAIGRGANGLVCYGYAVRERRYVAIKISGEVEEQPDIGGLPNTHGMIDRCGDDLEVSMLVGLGTVEQLAQRLVELDDQEFREQIIFHLSLSLLRSLAAAHDRHLYHRDIKPDNLLLSDEGELLVSDFGGATQSADGQILEDGQGGGFVGYKSPEAAYCMLHRPGRVGGAQVDGWAAALTLLDIVGHHWARNLEEAIFPFTAHSDVDQVQFERAITACIESCPPLKDPAPNTIWALIKEMLAFDPKLRLTPKAAHDHPWVTEMTQKFAPHRERVLALLREFVQESPTSTLSPQNIPVPNFENYIPRPDLEADLLRDLRGSDPVVLQGLPGVGKSTLAMRLLHAAKEEFGLVLWFDGAQFEQQLTIFLEEAGLPTEDPMAVARQFFGSFEERFGVRWLMVVLNAPGKEVLMPGGHTIITARDGWDDAKEIGPLGEDQARQLVSRLLQQDGEGVDRLCRHFANLPLGLVYACAHIRHHGGTIDAYLDDVRRVSDAIRGEERSYGREIPRTMAAQHALMLERLSPGGATLLRRLSCLATDHIDRRELITFDDDGAREELRTLALLQEDRPGAFSMHRLLQEMVWEGLDRGARISSLRVAFERLLEWPWYAMDAGNSDLRERANLARHLETSTTHSSSIDPQPEALQDLAAQAFLALGYQRIEAGRPNREEAEWAEQLAAGLWPEQSLERGRLLTLPVTDMELPERRARLVQAIATFEQVEDPWRATALNNLAALDLLAGDIIVADARQSAVLQLRREHLGAQHLMTAGAMINSAAIKLKLAEQLITSGDRTGVDQLEAAVLLCDEAIAICRQCGEEVSRFHAQALNLKGIAMHALGQPEVSLECTERAVNIWKEALGPSHVEVTNGLGVLFDAYQTRGQWDKALPVLAEMEEIAEAFRGPRSAELAFVLRDNARRLLEQERVDGVLARVERAKEILEPIKHEQAEEYARCIGWLGIAQQRVGDNRLAIETLREAATLQQAAFGEDADEFAWMYHHLGVSLARLGRWTEAAEAFSRAVEIATRCPTLGPYDDTTGMFQAKLLDARRPR